MNRVEKISANYKIMTPKEKALAKYIIENTKEVEMANIHELAKKINISSSSITRFVQKYFNQSFADFKVELAKEESEKKSYKYSQEILNWANSEDNLPTMYIESVNRVFRDVLDVNEVDKFEKAAKIITNAKTVVLFGVGTSGVVVTDFQQKLIRLNKKCIYNVDSNFGMLNSKVVDKNDVVIAISYSGRTKEVLLATEEAKKSGAKIITITSTSINPLENYADIALYTPTAELNSQRISSIFSRYAQLFIIDIIFLLIANKMSSSVDKFILQYHDLLEQLKK